MVGSQHIGKPGPLIDKSGPRTASPKPWRHYLIAALLLAVVAAWFASLDYRKLANPDEGRYAEIPREMVATGNWLTPRLNGIKYFEKPPLQYWVTAAAYKAFGFHEWTARLWPALTGLFGVVLAWFAGRRLFGSEAGIAAALVLLSSVYYVAFANVLTLDMGFSFFLFASLAAYLLAQPAANGRAWALTAWAAIGLAVLSKGLAGLVLPALALATYTAMQRDWSGWRRLYLVSGLSIALLICAPWFIAVSLSNPEFPRFFFIHEHVQRFASTVHKRGGAWWYYIPVVLLAMLPWIRVLAESLVNAWRHRTPTGVFNTPRFLLAWVVSQFLFFSFSGSKLPGYVLPIMPALALLVGMRLAELDGRQIAKRVAPLAILSGIFCFAGTEVMEAMHRRSPAFAYYEDYGDWLKTAAVLIASAGILLWWWRREKRAAIVAFSLACFVAAELMVAGFEQLSPLQSAYGLAQIIRPHLKPETPVFTVRTYSQSLPPYLQRPVTLVEYADELEFGLQQEPALSIPTLAEFAALWRQLPQGIAIMPAKTYDGFRGEGLPMRVIDSREDLRVVMRR